MLKSIRKIKYRFLYLTFTTIGLFIRNRNITKKKLLYGAFIISITAIAISCNTHRRTCYKVATTNYFETNDTTNIE